ncbi:SMI1/KNR4 family protein [Actinoplanes utahensis]|uniref:SMI1/KNR4 family protein n=1 Tax=Actinoplanes utahensis TaxID=1869 RepID=UPI00068C9B97|nr:SMI1/KNR4 family protein [Actinoplanes utahensis]
MESFAAVFGPPPTATPPRIDWAAVESWLGLTLPADYKAIASAYGPLDIGEHIWLHVPCKDYDGFDYGDWLAQTHRHCRVVSRETSASPPPILHPQPGGLLAWGSTRTADHLFWDTSAGDDPDRWPVVVFRQDTADEGADPWLRYGTPLVETLVEATRNGLPLPGGGRLDPIPATLERTAFLRKNHRWAPPEPAPPTDPRRRAALTEGEGLAALTTLVPPPATPRLGDGAWEDLFARLGTRLPDEYVTLMDRYGAGTWRDWLAFPSPRGDAFDSHVEQTLDAYRELRAEFPEYNTLAVWPEPGGFLPFATSLDGDELGWLTEGDPDSWKLIVYPRHDEQGPPLPGGLIETLLAWTRGRFDAPGLVALDEDDDPLEFATFEPFPE